MPLPRWFTQFPPLVAHFAIVSPSAHLISLIILSFIPSPLLFFSSFSCTSLSFGCFLHPFCLLVFRLFASSCFLIYFSFPSVFLFQPCVRPCFLSFSYFTLSPLVSFPPSFPHLFSSSAPLPHPPLASLLQSYNCGHDGP